MTGDVIEIQLGDVIPWRLAVGGDGNLWFTTTSNQIGRLTMSEVGR